MRVFIQPPIAVRILGITLGTASLFLLQPLVFVGPGGLFGLATTTIFFIVPYGITCAIWFLIWGKSGRGT